MPRQRCRLGRILSAGLPAALALTALLLFSSFAGATVQVFVNTVFVNTKKLGNCAPVAGTPVKFQCPIASVIDTAWPSTTGNISNDPQIQFDQEDASAKCNIGLAAANPNIPGTVGYNVCNAEVYLCAQVGITNNESGAFAIDELNFEVFKFEDGTNPTDPATAPPLRTFFIDSPGNTGAGVTSLLPASGTDAYCVLWDGSYNIQGEFGKTNGQYGFRVTVKTNQSGGASGNIVITQTRAYPSGATYNAAAAPAAVPQKPITVDVTNVHVIRSTPAVVGQITGVAAQPYSFNYRLSKDASMYISVLDAENYGELRTVLRGQPRVGEGEPKGTLQNGDSWDGRDNFGNIMPSGNYLAVFQALSDDQYTAPGGDLSVATTRQIVLDPLQITDIRVQPLLGGATSLAVLSYMLTEPATTYIDIYPPGTQFCRGFASNNAVDGSVPAKGFGASLDGCVTQTLQPLRTIMEQKPSRSSVISFWDGRTADGTLVGDGDYVFVMYASLASQKGVPYPSTIPLSPDKRIWTLTAKSGFLPVIRGLVGITQISPTSTVIGSSPAIAGLNPFFFRYQLSRDAIVSVKIYDGNGTRLVKTLVNGETRPGLFNNSESWTDGTDNAGQVVSSGTYYVQLTAADPLFPAKVSTTTAQFPIDLMRITDVSVTPLLSGASDQVVLSYQLSQPMFVAWNIYPAGSYVSDSVSNWPPCASATTPGACTSGAVLTAAGGNATPVVSFRGLRPGRMRISEYWDGRDANGLFVPDGNYVYTLTAQSTTTPKYFPTDRIYGSVTVARGSIIFTSFSVNPDVPQLFNSSNTITLHPYTISYALTRQSSVTVQILSTDLSPRIVRTVVSGAVRQGGILQTDVWDGRDDSGNFPPTGFYLVRAMAEDVASVLTSGSTAQITISYDPLRIYDLAVAPLRADTGEAMVSYQVSETMKVAIKIYKPGTYFDSSGNAVPAESLSLVRVIVGIRPPRTQIQEFWDGRDFRGALLPDGNYKFKIVGSTVASAIDNITGDAVIPTALSLDRLIDDIPVATNGGLGDIDSEFTRGRSTFFYPNPVTAPCAKFDVYLPFRADVIIKMYTMSGDFVWQQSFSNIAKSADAGGGIPEDQRRWCKTNQGGRQVARGLYYAVIRLEETEGGRQVLQTVKKVLVP